MLGNFALGHSKNTHSHHWFWSPAHITAMNHDVVAVDCNHARFVIEGRAERGKGAENRVGAVRNCGVVLRIVVSKVPADNRRVATDKNSGLYFHHDLFVADHVGHAVSPFSP
jgi:hypothetical protein